MTSERIKRLLIGFQSIQPTEVESEKCSPSQNVRKLTNTNSVSDEHTQNDIRNSSDFVKAII
jgi:hypothetical protein